MTSPRLENEAIRLGIIAPKPDSFEWMNATIYEPAPLPFAYGRSRSWRLYLALVFAVLAVATGALIALSGWRP